MEVFKYLVGMLAYNNNDTQAMRANLKKVRRCLVQILGVLNAENVSPQTSDVFYKATDMAVLLFGSETWNLAPLSLRRLQGFHIWAAWRMAGTGPWRNQGG